MTRSRWLLCLVLAVGVPLVGCSEGEECDVCEVDADCKEGFMCVNFLDDEGGIDSRRCGSGIGATTCRIP